MSSPIITVENLSKRYRLGVIGATTLRDSVQRTWHRLRGRNWRHHMEEVGRADHNPQTKDQGPIGQEPVLPDELWALRDVSFEVKRGEVLGIIGRNGAGKSTLLKLLTRITEPTSGRAIMRGRVASLLEVGTGFHPELTGRENIYLNGAILGMKRAEISLKFDQIVDFSGVSKFIDTPVKRYSSGMYVRLAFAVAAHLEPDILLVDEVLAVGDADFQKRCLGKMGELGQSGRTILIVSHNMASICNLCQQAILLRGGQVIDRGAPQDVVEHYLANGATGRGEVKWPVLDESPGDERIRMRSVRVTQGDEQKTKADVDISGEVRVEISYDCLKDDVPVYAAMWLKDKVGTVVFSTGNMPSMSRSKGGVAGRPHEKGTYRATCIIPGTFLNEGQYNVTPIIGVVPSKTVALLEDEVSFTVHDTGEMRKEYYGGWIGVIRPMLEWSTSQVREIAQ